MVRLILLILISILLPPLAVFLKIGVKFQFWLNLILFITVVGAPVAMVHALFVTFTDGKLI